MEWWDVWIEKGETRAGMGLVLSVNIYGQCAVCFKDWSLGILLKFYT